MLLGGDPECVLLKHRYIVLDTECVLLTHAHA